MNVFRKQKTYFIELTKCVILYSLFKPEAIEVSRSIKLFGPQTISCIWTWDPFENWSLIWVLHKIVYKYFEPRGKSYYESVLVWLYANWWMLLVRVNQTKQLRANTHLSKFYDILFWILHVNSREHIVKSSDPFLCKNYEIHFSDSEL